MFEPTNEPEYIDPDLEMKHLERTKRFEEERIACESERHDQEISDSMERFYNPEEYYKRKESQRRLSNMLKKVFVGGLSYD